MLRNRLCYLVSLLVILLFHCFYTGWVSWLFFLLVLLLPVFSLLVSLPAILRTKIRLEMPTRCKRGGDASLRLYSGKGCFLPTPVCLIRYRCEDMVWDQTAEKKLRLGAWKEHTIVLPTGHCGTYGCTVTRGRILDYMGLFAFPLPLPQAGTLMVLPRQKMPQPLPNLTQFQSKSYRPKHGGGFSEIHDMREYRPGDSLRDIHWKLSAKTDDLIVREAQEPNRGQTLLTLDLCGSRAQLDEKLDILCWLSRWLLGHDAAHLVCWLDGRTLEPQTASVACQEDLDGLITQLLSTPLAAELPSIRDRAFPNVDWRYHIDSTAEGEEAV